MPVVEEVDRGGRTPKKEVRFGKNLVHQRLVVTTIESVKGKKMDESALVKMYMDLTGASESGARGVFMYVCLCVAESFPPPLGLAVAAGEGARLPRHSSLAARSPLVSALLVLASLWSAISVTFAQTVTPALETNRIEASSFLERPLSLADAVNVALQQNPAILKAQKEVEATQGVVIQTRAVAVPRVNVGGNYSAVQPGDTDVVTIPLGENRFTIGNDQNWGTQIRLSQSIYEGGRILSSLRVARLLREQSLLNYHTVMADAVLDVQLAYFDVLLAAEEITVQEASVELLTRELTDTQRRFEAGTVPRFNVLRAEVELGNARPRLIRARNSLRIAKNRLTNVLGIQLPKEGLLDIPLTLSGKLEAEPYTVDLGRAIASGLERRTELAALRKAQALRREDIVNAKAGFKPSLQAYVGYDAHNSTLSQDLTDENHGWITGVQLAWNLFEGGRTRGRVKETTALYERAGVELDDAGRRVELEVRTAYSTFMEANEVLKSQEKVLEQAEEALRLASARSDAGSGTQLDVLSAQTALTDARSTHAKALHAYAAARARLDRAIGSNLPKT